MTEEGMRRMIEKMEKDRCPQCPRVMCRGSICLPCGTSDNFLFETVKWFCPRCSDFYDLPMDVSIDSGYFGKRWIHIMMHDHPDLVTSEPSRRFTPDVFGFKVFLPEARVTPR
jgi:casein kinase II subunit beta